MIQIILSWRLSTDALARSVCGHLFSGWRTETYLRRSVHDWRIRIGILFSYMGGCIIYGLVHHHLLRRSTIAQTDIILPSF
jgi:hypothetical protein